MSMEVKHIGQGKDTLTCIDKVPTHLDAQAKKCYKEVGNFLAKINRLRETNLHNLEVFAIAYSEFVWASVEINAKNRKKRGSGYVQKFPSGATNVTTEVSLRNAASKKMLEVSKLFGLDPKSEKELKGLVDDSQKSLLEYDAFLLGTNVS